MAARRAGVADHITKVIDSTNYRLLAKKAPHLCGALGLGGAHTAVQTMTASP